MIWLLITTCVHNRWGHVDPDVRKREYIESLRETLSNVPSGIRVILIENSTREATYLDQFGHVDHTWNNLMQVANKGIIEFTDLQEIMGRYSIADDDIVVKLTGRYPMTDSTFLTHIQSTMSDYDLWSRFMNVCTQEEILTDFILGCYAIRAKYLKGLDVFTIGATQSMECDFSTFVRATCPRICTVDRLGISYRIGDGLLPV